LPRVRSLPAGVSPVYEDLFPIGTVPSDPCPIHTRAVDGDQSTASAASTTPMLDSILGASSSVAATSVTLPTTDIVLERVLGPDGVMRMVMRKR
jgi:hypothetical protein